MLFSLITVMLLVLSCAFWFSKTSKEVPKSWYEWKMEMRYQYVGIVGLIEDFIYRPIDKVDLYKQPERVAVITGGNRGIGLRIVEKLLNCDINVIMGVRDPKAAEEEVRKLVNLEMCRGKLLCKPLDIGNLKSVDTFAKAIKSSYKQIHTLINNAGIMFAPYEITEDGYESHFAINYLGHFYLQYLLINELKNAGRCGHKSRIVNISSCAHLLGRIDYEDMQGKKNYNRGAAYAQSKLAQIMSGRHLQRLLNQRDFPVQVVSVHPGIVDTDLFEYSATTAVPIFKKLFFKTPEEGSRTPVYGAISPLIEGQGGIYLSNCRQGKLHPIALNSEKCEKLFRYTCDLLKIDFHLL